MLYLETELYRLKMEGVLMNVMIKWATWPDSAPVVFTSGFHTHKYSRVYLALIWLGDMDHSTTLSTLSLSVLLLYTVHGQNMPSKSTKHLEIAGETSSLKIVITGLECTWWKYTRVIELLSLYYHNLINYYYFMPKQS